MRYRPGSVPPFGLTAPRWGRVSGLGVEPRHAHHGRRPRPGLTAENITDASARLPGRLITQALEATAHGRALAARLAPGTNLFRRSGVQIARRS